MGFSPNEPQLSLCFLLWVFLLSSLLRLLVFGHASLVCMYRGCVSVLIRYYTYLPEIVLLPSAAVFASCQADDDWMCLCERLHHVAGWFCPRLLPVVSVKRINIDFWLKPLWHYINLFLYVCACLCNWGFQSVSSETACSVCLLLSLCASWRQFIVAHVARQVKLFSNKFIIVVECLVTGALLSVLITKICRMSAGQTVSRRLCF